jgi:hypothetical protein
MPKNARLSRDQKRKQKLAKRQARQAPSPSSAYQGNRYRSPEFVKPTFATEKAIYTAFVASGRKLTDAEVEEHLEALIAAMRIKPAAELIYPGNVADTDLPDGWVAEMILRQWEELLEAGGLPPRDDLIGILRSILGSLETWRSRSAGSRGYLHFLEGFVNKLGFRVELADEHGNEIPEDVDELFEVGQMWLAGSDDARHQFRKLAEEMLAGRQGDRVANASLRLLGLISDQSRPEFPILSELAIRAQKLALPAAKSGFAGGLKNFAAKLGGW